jgi:biopolymer transport protein ExbD
MKSKVSFGKKEKNTVTPGHNLTSLVDCFAIILIYLLMATSFGEIDLTVPKGMQMPQAVKTQSLVDNTVVLISENTYSIAGRIFALSQLAEEFKRLHDEKAKTTDVSKAAIVIQADKNISYGQINPVVLAGLQAGFSEVQFAVLKDEGGEKL